MKPAYQQSSQELLKAYHSTEAGLSSDDAALRLSEYGLNQLTEGKKKTLFSVFLEQFQDLLVLILIAAAAISWVSGNAESSLVIFAVILLNALLGTVQYQKAQKSLASLKAMSAPHARILRDGIRIDVPASDIVPGDILLLEAGDIVPADGRILHNFSLQVNESSLTGESTNVEKIDSLLEGELPLADRVNLVYSGSLVTYGRAEALVTATGMDTEIGKIADLMNTAGNRKTPLQISLDQFSQKLAFVILGICAVVFFLGLFRNMGVLDSLLFAVALAVAAIPEALGSIVTIVQALGTQKMAKEHAILKELKAVESLGCVSVICSDKTGTLTQNKMTVQQIFLDGQLLSPEELDLKEPLHRYLLYDAILANDSSLEKEESEETKDSDLLRSSAMLTKCSLAADGIGDPTEYCLLLMARRAGLDERVLRDMMPRLEELPFDSVRKLMSVKYKLHGIPTILTKGAVDEMLLRTTHIFANGEIRLLTEADKQAIMQQNQAFSENGLRVLAFGFRQLAKDIPLSADTETGLCFIGLTSIMDPPRPESAQAVLDAKRAGIRPVMITGDHKVTAAAIAKQIGIFEAGDYAITGSELDQMSEKELEEKIEKISVYARVSPENKIRIVETWQKKGHIVAMTGDGVNDAPALKKSDIGVAMGITGTEVSKDASSMILTDDNFATIIKSIANGRNVYQNIRNAILFLLSGNTAGILSVLYASLAGLPMPFVPVQLLFINLVTDSLPAIAIGMEEADGDLLSEKPRNPREGILNSVFFKRMLLQGILITIFTLTAYHIGLSSGSACACTMAFSTLTLARLFHGFNCRSKQSIFKAGILSNPYSLAAFFTGALLLALVLFLPPLQTLFSVVPLNAKQAGSMLLLAFLPTFLIQLFRVFRKK